ncbi:sigma-70 family RNA polymerase sigma factor [Aureibaculum sp. 2210JD6-5]|uniref:RNA polymerase sigma factor n=1 Tax=Aureibaculum sp. 2210JD6-5 TaxID=3103957 RepID=UPI002AAC9A36|nr:sigma-70 family RNA polymerase sigma factor [Aureibaculum sp. 2210JD6-5]MDY7397049.1 sigma-70 family RNA polymerase sigma factor [Aureibaculum sp. 2210JD6-5]
METKDKNTKKGLYGLASLNFEGLIRSKENNDKDEFKKLIQNVLPHVRNYINQRLGDLIRKRNLPRGKYKTEDFVNNLYIEAYEHIGELGNSEELHTWLFKKADELIDNTLVQEEFNEFYFKNIEKYSKIEWDQMEENFSTDGDGDLMMLEEFDDPSYRKPEYSLDDVFVQENPEEALLDKLNFELSQNQMHNHIDLILHHLPAPMKSIYDLSVNQKFGTSEIAKIKGFSVRQVEQYLEKTREAIRKSFEKRFNGD